MNKKYKEFDLKQALNGAKVETRDGRKVKYTHLINISATDNPRPLIAVVEDIDSKHDDIINFTENGRFWDNKNDSSLDLFIVEGVKTHYVNVYKYTDGRLHFSSFSYETKQKAIENISEPKSSIFKYLKTIEVTDEVDEVVEEVLDDKDVKYFNDFSDMMDYLIKNS